MNLDEYPNYYGDANSLLIRLTQKPDRKVVFLVGSALCQTPTHTDASSNEDSTDKPTQFKVGGVPNSVEVIDLIAKKLGDTKEHPEISPQFIEGLRNQALSVETRYQLAFHTLLSHCGPDKTRQVLIDIVKTAWLVQQYSSPDADANNSVADERQSPSDRCREMEEDISSWAIPPGATALGEIIAEFPERCGPYLLTTNFDPLLAISIRRARGHVVQTALYSDSNPALTMVNGCHLVHLHGYWYRDALHTPEQLKHERRNLSEFLKFLIRKYTIVVMGYGGWDDQVLDAIRDVVEEQNQEPDILWTFFGPRGNPHDVGGIGADHGGSPGLCRLRGSPLEPKRIEDLLRPGIARGRVHLYQGIDCNAVLPDLLSRLREGDNAIVQRIIDKARQDSERGSLAADTERLVGRWILVSTHGARDYIDISVADRASPKPNAGITGIFERIVPYADEGGFRSRPGSLFDNDKSIWEIPPPLDDGAEGSWPKEQIPDGSSAQRQESNAWKLDYASKALILKFGNGYEIWVREACDSAIHYCSEHWPPDNRTTTQEEFESQSDDSLEHLHTPGDKRAEVDQSRELWQNIEEDWERRYAKNWPNPPDRKSPPGYRRSGRTRPIVPEIVAIHVPPWDPKIRGCPELSKGGVTQGHWLKLADFGGSYLVKLQPDGTLTEKHLFDNTRISYGRWWIDDPDDPLEGAVAASPANLASGPFHGQAATLNILVGHWNLRVSECDRATNAWQPLFCCLEREPRRNRITRFFVAHVLPGNPVQREWKNMEERRLG